VADEWAMATKVPMHTDTHKHENAGDIPDNSICWDFAAKAGISMMLHTTAEYDNVTNNNMATSDKESHHNCVRQIKSGKQDCDSHPQHQNGENDAYHNNGGWQTPPRIGVVP
jgi:hypothetical protein